MTQQPSAALDTIQIRYRIGYMTFLRMMAWKRTQPLSMSKACNVLLNCALDEMKVTRDPAVLLGLEEKPGA
ncbi:hypothetical protein ES707_09600 [subsurface metagenome]